STLALELHEIAAARDLWTCIAALAKAWEPATPYDGEPDIRLGVTQAESQSVWGLHGHHRRPQKIARYRQTEVWARAAEGALVGRRPFFATSIEALSMAMPLQHEDVT